MRGSSTTIRLPAASLPSRSIQDFVGRLFSTLSLESFCCDLATPSASMLTPPTLIASVVPIVLVLAIGSTCFGVARVATL